jgi:iron(III) transport system substrate-binding protein
MRSTRFIYVLILFVVASCAQTTNEDALTLYTHRHYDTDQQIFDEFEAETGIKINVVNASADELIQRLESEGEQSPADLLISVDAGRLVRAKEKDLLQPFASEMIENTVPDYLQDTDNAWVSITKRARIIVFDKNEVEADELSTYEALTDEKWNNELLIRSSGNIYNQSLLASIIANNGEEAARDWAEGIVENFARNPQGNDRDQVKAILAGEGNLAVVNTYYLGRLINSSDELERNAGNAVEVFFPNQEGRGAHINVSGIGIAKHSKKAALATQFIEYLLSKEVQEIFAGENYEYPVNPEAETSELLQSWGSFKEDPLPLQKLGELNQQAVILFDQAGWQ